ncbi:MAG: hypothetical protein WD278_04985 [Pirellulales bacterium]
MASLEEPKRHFTLRWLFAATTCTAVVVWVAITFPHLLMAVVLYGSAVFYARVLTRNGAANDNTVFMKCFLAAGALLLTYVLLSAF